MTKSNWKITLNSIGPFIGLPCLGEVAISRNFGFALCWLLLPGSFYFSWLVWNAPTDGIFWLALIMGPVTLAVYPIVSLIPFIRDGIRRYRAKKLVDPVNVTSNKDR